MTAEAQRTDTGDTERVTADFVYSCTGYYRYDEGYTPEFPGADRFTGTLVHPQHWPEELSVRDREVVVIGSGATAVTLVPSLAETAAHVTMLQRSPSYVIALPNRDPIADRLRRRLPDRVAYPIIRWKNVLLSTLVYQLSRRAPEMMRKLLRWQLEHQLPDDFDIDTHFTPDYDPWDQRLCVASNADLFAALRAGRASIVTDTIETFTEHGIALSSGRTLEADLSDYVCRLLDHMEARGYRQVTPQRPDPSVELRPLIDLTSGYVRRSIDEVPQQTTRAPSQLHQNYLRDMVMFRRGELDDEGVRFSHWAI